MPPLILNILSIARSFPELSAQICEVCLLTQRAIE
ncbi:Histone deacetylase [Giardia duodenalis assemblage B]|uniref:Histone deacetylase n=2 Tax=Giardia intestinalis TaxID=5741 RepID=A0A132NU08_GIAIN|nr:Histone deacetylase [Giardia intestinalis]KWX13564.1 Histone deacetylase [Giardia intestinalis assemblage B]